MSQAVAPKAPCNHTSTTTQQKQKTQEPFSIAAAHRRVGGSSVMLDWQAVTLRLLTPKFQEPQIRLGDLELDFEHIALGCLSGSISLLDYFEIIVQ